MRNLTQCLLAIVLIAMGGMIFGAIGLALGGVATGLLINSGKRGFFLSGIVAGLFWLIAAVVKITIGQSPQLLALAGSLANLSGAKGWLLILLSSVIAFVTGGLGGWLGGSLRQMSKKRLRTVSAFKK